MSGTVAKRCACRAWIVAPDEVSSAMAAKVREHQMEEPHKSWRSDKWVQRNTGTMNVPTAVLRKVG